MLFFFGMKIRLFAALCMNIQLKFSSKFHSAFAHVNYVINSLHAILSFLFNDGISSTEKIPKKKRKGIENFEISQKLDDKKKEIAIVLKIFLVKKVNLEKEPFGVAEIKMNQSESSFLCYGIFKCFVIN